MVTIDTLKRGFKKGLETIWILSKVIIPIYMIVTILKHTPVLNYVAVVFSPLMKMFGLPGEAAIVLVLGGLINIYAAIGAIMSLTLTAKQITILAVMISFAHNLLVETAVSTRVGVSARLIVGFRILLAVLGGLIINVML